MDADMIDFKADVELLVHFAAFSTIPLGSYNNFILYSFQIVKKQWPPLKINYRLYVQTVVCFLSPYVQIIVMNLIDK